MTPQERRLQASLVEAQAQAQQMQTAVFEARTATDQAMTTLRAVQADLDLAVDYIAASPAPPEGTSPGGDPEQADRYDEIRKRYPQKFLNND